MRSIADFAEKHDLRVEIRADWAFYFPSTAFVIIYTKNPDQ